MGYRKFLNKERTIIFLKREGGSKKKYSCTAFVEEIKIVHSSTKQRNLLAFSQEKNACRIKLPNRPPTPSKI